MGVPYFTVPGLLAGASQTSNQFKVMKFASTAGEVIIGAAGSDSCIGILLNNPADGEPAEIAALGVTWALAETGVTAGDHLACSATGRVKTTTSANDHVLGVAIDASSSAGDKIRIILSRGNY